MLGSAPCYHALVFGSSHLLALVSEFLYDINFLFLFSPLSPSKGLSPVFKQACLKHFVQ
jgi:hypothetical protein